MKLMQVFENQRPRKHSVGIVLTDGKQFLICHPTGGGSQDWEVPKGIVEQGEPLEQAAVREFMEECGVKLDPTKLEFLQKFQLHATKDVSLYRCMVAQLPSISTMKCVSTFRPYKYRGDYETRVPEVDDWKYITADQIHQYVRDEMVNALTVAMTPKTK